MLYDEIKKIVYSVLPARIVKKNKKLLRRLYAPIYWGNKHECNICAKKNSRFIKINNDQESLCPYCGSISRDRRVYQLIKERIDQTCDEKPLILDFSPSDCIYHKLVKNRNIIYFPTDLLGNFNAAYKYDITCIPLEDNYLDYIICFHVLEHIIEDNKAMKELYRTLKPNGKVFIQTPFKDGEIYEDFSIVSPQEREVHFGQDDHVRIYSVDGLVGRLRQVGFNMEIIKFDAEAYFGGKANEVIIIATK